MAARAPAFRLVVDGRDITPKVEPRLISLSLSEKRGEEADQLTIVIADHDGALEIPPEGAVIGLALGWRGEPLVEKGSFTVDEPTWDGSASGDRLTLRARSADFTAAFRVRKDRSWRDTTLGRVLQDLAAAHGLKLQASAALRAKPVETLEQSGRSDGALLRELGRRYDAVATVKAGTLLFGPKGAKAAPSGVKLPPLVLTRSDGDSVAWKRAARDKYSGVTAKWHDGSAARKRKAEAGKDGNRKALKRVYGSEAEAKRAAAAEWSRLQRGEGSVDFSLAIGRPEIYPERPARFEGPRLKPEITGAEWIVEEVEHELAGGGLTTRLKLEAAA